jgi:Glycosyl hydrolase family 71
MSQRNTAAMTCGFALAALLSACRGIAVDAKSVSPTNSGSPGNSESCLAFAMPDSATLFSSPKKVFAHYFYPFPLSVGNKTASDDYYSANYLLPTGESGKWSAQGGYLRQRPLPVDVGSAADFQRTNVEREVRLAIARGITGFTIDVMSSKEASDPKSHLHMLLTAAQSVDSRFKIVVMPDISALKGDSASVLQIIAAAAASPAAYRLADGRLVVTAFNAGLNTPDWWSAVFSQLKTQGINVAFVPTFLGWGKQADAFAAISHGFSDWGTATASSSEGSKHDAEIAHAKYGKIYMLPVDPQQYRPKGSIYWEAGNSSAFRNSWRSAIDGNADWVQIVTWSDFSESSEIEPYTDTTLRRDIGTGYYDLNAYYASWFLTGKPPAITHDVLYYFYRREPTNAASRSQQMPNKIVNGSPEDNIEMLAFLTAPGVLKITINGHSFTQQAPAGVTSFKIPTQPGTPTFSVSRNGVDALSFEAPVRIYGPEGLPSGVIDMTYWSGSGSRNGVCTL